MGIFSAIGRVLSRGADAPPAAEQTGKPVAGEVTGPQPGGGTADQVAWCGTAYANGGSHDNPCGFWNYGGYYAGTLATYRFMLTHPRLRHARAQVASPIAANAWGWETRDDAKDEWVDFCRETVTPLRAAMIDDALRMLDYGYASFEKVWRVERGRYVLDRLKPLLADRVAVLLDAGGNLAGVEVDGDRANWLGVHKCFHASHDGEAGDPWGRPLLENVRTTAWRDWLDAAADLVRLSHNKITGIVPIITTPAGTYTDAATGATVKWKDNAAAAIRFLQQGKGIWFPTLALPANTNPENVALAKVSLINISTIDFGDQAPAVLALLARMRADEDLMFAGYLRSSRTGMDSEHGSRADSEQHTDTDTTVVELIDARLAEQFNRQVIDDLLVLNFGPAARGAVRVKPAKLRDEHRATDYKILDAILADPDLRPRYIGQLDSDAITERRGIPKLDGVTIDLSDVPTDGPAGDDDAADDAADPEADDDGQADPTDRKPGDPKQPDKPGPPDAPKPPPAKGRG